MDIKTNNSSNKTNQLFNLDEQVARINVKKIYNQTNLFSQDDTRRIHVSTNNYHNNKNIVR